MDKNKLPKFKYHPNVYECGEVKFSKGICNCCGKEVDAYVQHMYTRAHVDCICMIVLQVAKQLKSLMALLMGMILHVNVWEKMEVFVVICFGVCIAENTICG